MFFLPDFSSQKQRTFGQNKRDRVEEWRKEKCSSNNENGAIENISKSNNRKNKLEIPKISLIPNQIEFARWEPNMNRDSNQFKSASK